MVLKKKTRTVNPAKKTSGAKKPGRAKKTTVAKKAPAKKTGRTFVRNSIPPLGAPALITAKDFEDKIRDTYSVGDTIRHQRMALGMSQVELAHALECTNQYLCSVENNRTSIGIEFAVRVAEVLQLPANFLVEMLLSRQLEQYGLDIRVTYRDESDR